MWWGLASCASSHLLCPHIVEGAKELSGIFYKIINLPSQKRHTYDLITFWRLHLQIPLHWGLGFKHEFWGVHSHSVLVSLYVYVCVCFKGIKKKSFLLIPQIEMFLKHLSFWFIFSISWARLNLTWVVIVDGLPLASIMVLTLSHRLLVFLLCLHCLFHCLQVRIKY